MQHSTTGLVSVVTTLRVTVVRGATATATGRGAGASMASCACRGCPHMPQKLALGV